MPRPGPSVTSGADLQPGSDSLFPSGFTGGGAKPSAGSVGTGEIADGSVAAADLNLSSVATALAARPEFTGTYARLAPDWAPGQTIKAGELRVYGGVLYRRKADGSTGTSFTAANWTQIPDAGTPAATPIILTAPQFFTQTGSPTTTTVSGWPATSLVDASTNGIVCVASLVPGVEYDVYVRWAPSTQFSGQVTLGWAVEYFPEGQAAPGGISTRFVRVAAPLILGGVVRTQLQETALATATGTGITVRVRRDGGDAADTYAGTFNLMAIEFIPRLPVREAAIIDAGSLVSSVSKWDTPYKGATVQRTASIFTPIWSTASNIYVAEPVTIGGVQQSRLAKLDKTTKAALQDAQLGTGTHDSILGHRLASVAVTDTGTVVAHPEGHHVAWAGKNSTSSEDLTTLTATTTPTGVDTNSSYRRFFRNPYNGDIWLGCRANNYFGGLYKWNGTGWTQVTGGFMTNQGQYGGELAFASATTMYYATEWFQNGATLSGYPRRGIAVVKSTDSGSTWSTMTGYTAATPLYPGAEARIAFPSPSATWTAVSCKVAVCADGNPLISSLWQHPSEAVASLWVAKWNPTTREWDRTRLMASNGTVYAGNPNMLTTTAGRIVIAAADIGDHDANGEIVPPSNNLYLFVTDDGVTWKRYLIGTGRSFGGANLDSESLRLDGKIRLLPSLEDVVTDSQVWEVTLPA